jgi:hypothetical protein
VSLLESESRGRSAVEDSSERVQKRIEEAAIAKVFPVIVICRGCNLEREQGAEENIWTKEGWSDGRVEKAA